MITGLDHVQLAMPPGEEERARAFYRDLLGLKEVTKSASLAGRGGCWFEQQRAVVHLGVQEEFAPALKAHAAFTVADLDELRQSLERTGHRVIPDETVPGVRRFYASDPFGNRLEFIQHGDGFAQRGSERASKEAVVSVVVRGESVLVIRRAESARAGGYWAPLSGRLEPGEEQEEAVVRETKEEVGLDVRPVRRVWECPTEDGSYRLHWWLAEFVGGELRPAPEEVSEARWIRPEAFSDFEPTFADDRYFFEHVLPRWRSE